MLGGIKAAILSWLGGYVVDISVTAIGLAADKMKDVAIEVVEGMEKAGENENLDGKDKFDAAWEILTDQFPESSEEAKNLAIEMGVAIVKESIR